jgi:putative transposase
MDETYVKHKGKDVYLYRAIDKHGLPEKVNVDKSGANEAALLIINIYLFYYD